MSDKVKDGGPAFPHHFESAAGHQNFCEGQGMSLRDWFAGQALANPTICTGEAPDWQVRAWLGEISGVRREQIVAAQAHAYADAMIAARSTET